MKLSELKSLLQKYPEAAPRFLLPGGEPIPSHFHVTEVGQVTKRFIDCGGKLHPPTETCLLQTHVGEDFEHRLNARRFAKILELGGRILSSDNLEVEVEYDAGVAAAYSIGTAHFNGTDLELELTGKRTACLAQERRRAEACCESACGC